MGISIKSDPKHAETLVAEDLGYKSNAKIYVNELLSFDTRRLFYKARKFKTYHGFTFAWTINQKVYLREYLDSIAILINSEDDLSKLG
jgi:hypothetical protein